jgi:type VI secretion system secreted protein Hcp
MAGDIFLKLEGIEGESTDDTHKKEFSLLSCSTGVSNAGSFGSGTTGGGTAKANFQDVSCAAYVSKASPELFLCCASGKHIPSATVVFRKAGGDAPVEYMKYELKNVMVTSYAVADSHNSGEQTVENFSLNFEEIKVTYTPQASKGGTAEGPVVQGWNLATNKKT